MKTLRLSGCKLLSRKTVQSAISLRSWLFCFGSGTFLVEGLECKPLSVPDKSVSPVTELHAPPCLYGNVILFLNKNFLYLCNFLPKPSNIERIIQKGESNESAMSLMD